MDKERMKKFLKVLGAKGAFDVLTYLDVHETAQYRDLMEPILEPLIQKSLNLVTLLSSTGQYPPITDSYQWVCSSFAVALSRNSPKRVAASKWY